MPRSGDTSPITEATAQSRVRAAPPAGQAGLCIQAEVWGGDSAGGTNSLWPGEKGFEDTLLT